MTRPRWVAPVIAATGLLVAGYAAGALAVPPAMFSDSGWGFAVWRSMAQGGPFNEVVQADPRNIARDAGTFLATWSPGQYLIPGVVTATGLSLGHAIVATVFVSSVIGLLGWFLVYRRLGFATDVAVLSCAIVAANRFFALPFGIYNGGEPLLFAGAPLIILVAAWTADGPFWRAGVFVLAVLGGFVLKNAVLVLALALGVAFTLEALFSRGPGSLRVRLGRALRWPTAFLVSYAVVYLAYTSKGWTPVEFSAHLADRATDTLLFAIAAPFMSAFSIDDGLAWILPRVTAAAVLDRQTPLGIAVVLVAIALWAYGLGLATGSGVPRYRFLLGGVLGVYVVLFGLLNVLGSAVSSTAEARHYRVPGLLLLPALVAVARAGPRSVRVLAVSVACLTGAYGVFSYGNKWLYLRSLATVGIAGVTQTSIDRAALAWLHATDTALGPGDGLFYLTSPELSLEVRWQRVILTQADFESVEMLRAREYRGAVGTLMVVVPARFRESGKADAILASFRDVERWRAVPVGDFLVYEAGRPWSRDSAAPGERPDRDLSNNPPLR